MRAYYRDNFCTIYHGDCRDIISYLSDIHACVTDAPYGLNFMNSKWDREVPGVDYWKPVYKSMLPGAHLLAMGGSRTFHRLVCAVEDSRFEIRDQLLWLYGTGFTKSHNVALGIDKHLGYNNRGRAIPTASSYQACDKKRTQKLKSNKVAAYKAQTDEGKEWEGYGTALKPAYEPIVLARKPLEGTVAKNVLKYGVGGLNIDDCKVPSQGRWPANILHDGSEEVVGMFPKTKSGNFDTSKHVDNNKTKGIYGIYSGNRVHKLFRGDSGSAARFFYSTKASSKEREHCLFDLDREVDETKASRKNIHPTVKPLALMKWMIKLITPPNGIVLDIFSGSGTTLWAAKELGFKSIGIELEEKCCEIAAKRLSQEVLDFGDLEKKVLGE